MSSYLKQGHVAGFINDSELRILRQNLAYDVFEVYKKSSQIRFLLGIKLLSVATGVIGNGIMVANLKNM